MLSDEDDGRKGRRRKGRKGPSIYDGRTEGGEGVKNCSKFADKRYIYCGQRGVKKS